MPDNQYKEVLIVVIACISLFLLLAAIILAFLFLHQRRKRLQLEEMEKLRQQLREQSLKAQLEIQEQTFDAISQEIHDNVGHLLSLAKVQINIISESELLNKPLLLDARDNIGRAFTDLRNLAGTLNSERIRTCSLDDTLLAEAARINRTGIIRADVVVVGAAREIEAPKKLILIRIIQECIQNCIKHAKATTVGISLHYQAQAIQLSIRDNGKGFDTAAALQNGRGLGLGNIRTRVHLTGGTHSIESVLNKGTHITITIPYE